LNEEGSEMRAFDYLVRCPSFPLISRKFPDFLLGTPYDCKGGHRRRSLTEFSKTVEVIPWQEEFRIGDFNPLDFF
jgi:hypothetical protein